MTDSAPARGRDARAKRAIAQVRTAFRKQAHDQLDAYLREADPETGLPTIDVLIAYMGQGWGCAVGVSLCEPEQETSVEERARASGIEIVPA